MVEIIGRGKGLVQQILAEIPIKVKSIAEEKPECEVVASIGNRIETNRAADDAEKSPS